MMKRLIVLVVVLFLSAVQSVRAQDVTQLSTREALQTAHLWIDQHPKQAEGYLFLAGVESAAWAFGEDQSVPIRFTENDADPPVYSPYFFTLFQSVTTDRRNIAHLKASLAAYRRAVEL